MKARCVWQLRDEELAQGNEGNRRRTEGDERVGKTWQFQMKNRCCQCVRWSSLGPIGHATALILRCTEPLHFAEISVRFVGAANYKKMQIFSLGTSCLWKCPTGCDLSSLSYGADRSWNKNKVYCLDQVATEWGFHFSTYQLPKCSLASVTEIFLPPKLRALLLGCTGGRKVVHNGKQHSAWGVPVKLPEAKGCFFFQFFPLCGAEQPYGNKPHSLLPKLPGQISRLGACWGKPGTPEAELTVLKSWIHVEIRGWPFTPCPTNTRCDRLCLATRSCQGQRVLSCTITSGCQGRPWENTFLGEPGPRLCAKQSWFCSSAQLWTLLSSRHANPSACWAFSGFKACTWQQHVVCSCLKAWAPFSPPLSELESWN